MNDMKKKIIELVEENNSNQIAIITNYLKIDGSFQHCTPKCKGESEELLALSDVIVCRLKDYCTCDEDTCECNDYVCFKYDWLNINVNQVVGFSVIK